MVELLKQGQYQPMALEDQVVGIFAGINGYLDDLPAEQVRPFEKRLQEFVRKEYPDIAHEISNKKVISPEIEQKLKTAIDKLKGEFKVKV